MGPSQSSQQPAASHHQKQQQQPQQPSTRGAGGGAPSSTITASPTTPPAGSMQSAVAVRKRQPKNDKANPADLAILDLKIQREKLKKAGDKYEKLSGKMKNMAREAIQADPEKNRANALALIKRSKEYEKRIDSFSNTLLNLETSINAIEDGIIQQQVLTALEGGKSTLEKINSDLSRADEVMEAVREAVQQSKEIGDILASTVSGPAGVDDIMMMDDSEFEDELAQLMGLGVKGNSAGSLSKTFVDSSKQQQQNVADQVKVPTHTPVPDVQVPKHELQQSHKVEEGDNNAVSSSETEEGRGAKTLAAA